MASHHYFSHPREIQCAHSVAGVESAISVCVICGMCRDFNVSMNVLCATHKWTTKLSSAGLVYFHFGRNVIAELTGRSPDDRVVKLLFDKVYENFVEEVDAIDNGIDPYPEKPRYQTVLCCCT